MGRIGLPELLIVLVIVLLVFGVGRIGKVAGEIGRGIRAFREGMNPKEDQPASGNEEHHPE